MHGPDLRYERCGVRGEIILFTNINNRACVFSDITDPFDDQYILKRKSGKTRVAREVPPSRTQEGCK